MKKQKANIIEMIAGKKRIEDIIRKIQIALTYFFRYDSIMKKNHPLLTFFLYALLYIFLFTFFFFLNILPFLINK